MPDGELRCRSIVIPALGCGVAGFDLEDGAAIIGEEITDYEPELLEEVQFIAYSDEEYDTVRVATEKAAASEQGETEADR